MQFIIKDNDEFKILPLFYNGDIIKYREVLLFIFNGDPYYTNCNIIQNTIIRYNSFDNYNRNKIKYAYRYLYNVHHDNKIGFIIADRRIHTIIDENSDELFNINNNKHIIINKDEYGDTSGTKIHNIEWDKKDVGDIEWIINNQSDINSHISSKTIKNINTFNSEFIEIYNKLKSKRRDEKIENMIYNRK